MPQTRVGYNPGPSAYRPFQNWLLRDSSGSGQSILDYARQLNRQATMDNNKTNTANYMLARMGPGNAVGGSDIVTTASGSETEEPSLLSQVFDWASVPLHTVMNNADVVLSDDTGGGFAEEWAHDLKTNIANLGYGAGALVTRHPEDSVLATVVAPWQPVLEGAANIAMGENWNSKAFEEFIDKHAPRKRGADILEERFNVENPWVREGVGFAADVALDPLSYVPGLPLVKGLKSIKNSGLDKLARRAGEAAGVVHTPDEILAQRAAGKYDTPSLNEAPAFSQAPEAFGQTALGQAVRSNVRQGMPTAEAAVSGSRAIPSGRGSLENLFPAALGHTRPAFDPTQVKPLRVADEAVPGQPTITREEFVSALDAPLGYNPKARIPRPAEQVARQVDNMNLGAQIKKGEALNPKLGTFSQQNVISIFKEVMAGNIPRTVQKFPGAVGEAAEEAVKVSDNIATHYTTSGGKITETVQSVMWNRIWEKTGVLAAKKYKSLNSPGAFNWRLKTAQSMLRTAEDSLIKAGHVPQHSTNVGLRLSDTLADIANPRNKAELDEIIGNFAIPNTKMIRSPAVRQSIQRQMARRSVRNVDFVSKMSQYAARSKIAVDKMLLDSAERRGMLDAIRSATEKAARESGSTPAEAKALRELVEKNADLPHTTQFNRIFTPDHGRQVVQGKVVKETIEKVDDEVATRFGTPYKKMKDKFGAEKGVAYTMLERFATWAGKGGMDRYALDALHHGEQSALRRAAVARSLLKNYTGQQLNQAAKMLQHGIEKVDDPKVMGAYNGMKKWTEELFGAPTLRDVRGKMIQKGHDGLAQRSNALMRDVNKELERMGFKSIKEFRFSNKKWVDKGTGRSYDFTGNNADSNGWMESWKSWDMGDDPATFLYNLDLAMERVGKRYTFMEDMAARFARGKKSDEFVHMFDSKKYPLLEGRYFSEEGYSFLKKTLDDLELGPWKPQMAITRHYATGLRVWKAGVTIYSPAHHIRNLVGDLFFTWTSGINDPRLFGKAAKVMNASGRYKQAIKEGDFATMRELTDPERAKYAAGPSDVIFKKNRITLTTNDVYVGAYSRGLLRDVNSIEELALDSLPGVEGASNKLAKWSPARGKGRDVATSVSQNREHYVRIHHFLGHVEKGVRKGRTDIKQLMDEAGHSVRKWHPDGSELTQLEQRARLLFPFYSWTRKAMPLVVQSMVQSPAKVLAYPRLQYAASSAMGLQEGNTEGLLDPFPDDQLFPDWIRVGAVGPLGDASVGSLPGIIGNFAETEEGLGGPYGYAIAEPPGMAELPPMSLGADFLGFGEYNAPGKGALSMLTPGLKVPLEVITEQRLPTGIPITGPSGDPMGYALDQIPILSYLAGVLNTSPKRQKDKGKLNQQRLLSLLTGTTVTGTAPYIDVAQFEARDRAR